MGKIIKYVHQCSPNLTPVSPTLYDRPGKLAFVLLIGLSGKDAAKNLGEETIILFGFGSCDVRV